MSLEVGRLGQRVWCEPSSNPHRSTCYCSVLPAPRLCSAPSQQQLQTDTETQLPARRPRLRAARVRRRRCASGCWGHGCDEGPAAPRSALRSLAVAGASLSSWTHLALKQLVCLKDEPPLAWTGPRGPCWAGPGRLSPELLLVPWPETRREPGHRELPRLHFRGEPPSERKGCPRCGALPIQAWALGGDSELGTR